MWKFKNDLCMDDHFEKCGILCFTTTVNDGDMKIEENRRRLSEYLKINKIIFGEQTHSDNIEIISKENIEGRFSGVDGYITCLKNVGLAVFTADCMPVFFFDRKKNIVGTIHAGRMGIEKKIASKALNMMENIFCSAACDIYVSVGPHIMNCCYGVDLEEKLKSQLTEKGIKDYCFSGICTHGKEFFSYRRDRTEQRMMSVIMAVDE